MEVCTYEIYQKSDPRPLVKVVTPVIRFLANLCAGPDSETLTLSLVRHPDTVPILMALLGTNYHHLCKETLWLFANIVNRYAHHLHNFFAIQGKWHLYNSNEKLLFFFPNQPNR